MSDHQTIRFPVHGMTCASCVNRITRAVRRLDGVRSVTVDLGREIATVRRDPATVSNEAIAAAVASAGYEAEISAAVVVVAEEPPSGLFGQLLSLFRQG